MPSTRHTLLRWSILALGVCVLALSAACGGDGAEPPAGASGAISRGTFVSTYVDLRLAALQDSSGAIAPEERDSILRAHRVTPQDLLEFAQLHGEDVDYMRDVWDAVDDSIRNRSARKDSSSS